ncbi:PepSY domain-containing protein [Fontimonas sp. SYSU GA230001]|uniref:PepSY domain-containing protein n=1 Tax=Fontimonas sp. SYSU GA230001 TaxID=3142450 RepID=UPI0032B4DC73
MRRPVLMLCLLAAIGTTPAQARPDADRDPPGRIVEPVAPGPARDPLAAELNGHRSLSPAEAARLAQRRYGGRVLAVEPEGRGYRVKLLRNGEVRSYQVDP